MKNFIFLTTAAMPTGLQIIGIADGRNIKDAFKKLVSDNGYLLKATFDKVFACELTSFLKKREKLSNSLEEL